MALLDDVKDALRVKSTAMDTEITNLIDACKKDLKISGIDIMEEVDIEPDPLVKRAIITYCKANFGYDNPDAERLAESYSSLKNHLAISADYHTYPEEAV